MAWKVRLIYSDGDSEVLDEEFDTEEAAIEAGWEASSNMSQGFDYLEEAGEDHEDVEVDEVEAFEE